MTLPSWYPQRSSADNAAAVVKNLIVHTHVPVTLTSVEQAVRQHSHYPRLSLQAISDILQAWHFETLLVAIHLTDLPKIILPAIAHLPEEGALVMLYQIKEERLLYIHPAIGWVEESVVDFGKKWGGALLVALPTKKTGEAFYAQKKQAEHIKQLLNPLVSKIRIIEDFLSEAECAYLICYATPLFEKSLVIDDQAKQVHEGRTSHSAMLRATEDRVLNTIYQKASQLLGIGEEYLEYGQCVSYTKGQQYQPHFDTLDENTPLGKETVSKYGQRAITILVYLNDDFEGGETYFPNLDRKIRPKKGTAVVFHLLDKDYRIDPYSLHAGLPVYAGRKYAFNLWVWNKPFRILDK